MVYYKSNKRGNSNTVKQGAANNTAYRTPHTAHNTPHTAQSTFRGSLKPLMTEEEKASAHIQELTYDFACRITRMYQFLTEDSKYKEYIISKQVFRSGTSIGANVREGQHAQSEADFLSKLSIAHKEADETCYWLSLLHDNGFLNESQFTSLNNDAQRIMRLLNTIVKTTRQRIENGKKNR